VKIGTRAGSIRQRPFFCSHFRGGKKHEDYDLTRLPARRQELHAELGHGGDRDRATFLWDSEPNPVALRHRPDPASVGLALAPAPGFT
jgi:hypothetical protein